MARTSVDLKSTRWGTIVVLMVFMGGSPSHAQQDGPKTGNRDQQQEKPTVKVKREGDRVWIEGAKELFHQHFEDSKNGRTTPWAERSDTYMYLTQMRIAGWAIDYADLMTVAGYGPSFAYAPGLKDKWMAHHFPPKGRGSRIAHATGCRYRWRQYKDAEDYWQSPSTKRRPRHGRHSPANWVETPSAWPKWSTAWPGRRGSTARPARPP